MIYDTVSADPFQIVQTGGVVALLVFALIGGNRGWWVFGWQYRQAVKEGEEWKGMCLALLRTTEKAAGLPPSAPPPSSTPTGGHVP